MGDNGADTPGNNRQFGSKAHLIFAGVVAAATLLYTFATFEMLSALRDANRLQQQSQRPYISIDSIRPIYEKETVGKENEKWQMEARIINSGPTPAEPVRAWIYWDDDDQSHVREGDIEKKKAALGPYGGSMTVSRVISAREARGILDRGPLYFHVIALYDWGTGTDHYAESTFQCFYEYGKVNAYNLVDQHSGLLADWVDTSGD